MAAERQDSDQRADTVVITGSEKNQSEVKNTGFSEFDHLSAPQFTEQCGSSQYPEAVYGGPSSFKELSNGAVGEQKQHYDQDEHAEPLSRKRKNKRFLVTCAVAFAIIFAATAGAVGGYFGGKSSNGDANVKDPSIIPTSTSQSHPNGQGSDVNNTDVGSGSGLRPERRPTDALNGTAMATLAYDAAEKYGADTTSENYLLFYQHSNGDIRKLVFNQSEWHSSELVTSDARIGTGLSVVQFGAVPTQIYMYYIDRLGYLQELRGTHGSNDWKNGTLGAMHFKAVDTYSALSASYIGKCGDRGNIGWVYYESGKGIQEALWAYDQDTWSAGTLFSDHAPGSDFWTSHDTSPITAWRMYSFTKDRRMQEHYCSDCCKNATMGWTTGESQYIGLRMWPSMLIGALAGLNGTIVDNSTLGLAGTMVNGSRILYYQNDFEMVMELNNTDFPTGSKAGYAEAWVGNPSTKGTGSRAVNIGVQASNGSGISTLSKAMIGSGLTVAQGFRSLTRQLYMFYQTNGSDITWRSRNEYGVGNWTDPIALNVGM